MSSGKAWQLNLSEMKVKVLVKQGSVTPGIWNLTDRFANKLIKGGKAEKVKEEKQVIESKEEKFAPQTKAAPKKRRYPKKAKK